MANISKLIGNCTLPDEDCDELNIRSIVYDVRHACLVYGSETETSKLSR
jgi:hypothetical protein